MLEKVDHLFAQKPQGQADIKQNKFPLLLLSLLLQILFNAIFCIQRFRRRIVNNFKRYF